MLVDRSGSQPGDRIWHPPSPPPVRAQRPRHISPRARRGGGYGIHTSPLARTVLSITISCYNSSFQRRLESLCTNFLRADLREIPAFAGTTNKSEICEWRRARGGGVGTADQRHARAHAPRAGGDGTLSLRRPGVGRWGRGRGREIVPDLIRSAVRPVAAAQPIILERLLRALIPAIRPHVWRFRNLPSVHSTRCAWWSTLILPRHPCWDEGYPLGYGASLTDLSGLPLLVTAGSAPRGDFGSPKTPSTRSAFQLPLTP